MPMYEYRCPCCAAAFEERRSMSAAGMPAVCPTCGSDAERQMSRFVARVLPRLMQKRAASPAPTRHGFGCACHGALRRR